MTPGSARTARIRRGSRVSIPARWCKIGNCRITVSVHAVGERGTLPVGWRLHLPEDSVCLSNSDGPLEKIPRTVVVHATPQLARVLIAQASGWALPIAPALADCADADDTVSRTSLHTLG